MKEVYIVSAVRTPMGAFGGTLAAEPATKLGAVAIRGAMDRIKLDGSLVNEVIMGVVLQANLGQAPARQAARYAGLPDHVVATTLNKVCASGMKAIAMAAQSIMLGDNDIVIAGGMENMSMVPYYAENNRWGAKYGHTSLVDGLAKDGLMDVYSNQAMGNCAEICARDMKISREEQDAFAISSYKKAAEAWAGGKFKDEIVPVKVKTKKEEIEFAEDEEYKNVKFDKIPTLKPAFQKDGTVTAANASTMNDGAAAVVLMSKEKADELGIKPLAKIRSFADAEQSPEWFTTSPSKALPKAVKKAGLEMKDISYFELHEAFSVVGIANTRLMNLDPAKVNIHGGAVALGHPLGASGARIVVGLVHILRQNKARYGAAGACNGGGGASAMVIESVA
ncbi:MAG TPA: acetyl-CoA C-acyltransferase [Bacteroidia bacterium]|nr:acetyl-CoA C-acyltransferase [Bacteroidia bacterium]